MWLDQNYASPIRHVQYMTTVITPTIQTYKRCSNPLVEHNSSSTNYTRVKVREIDQHLHKSPLQSVKGTERKSSPLTPNIKDREQSKINELTKLIETLKEKADFWQRKAQQHICTPPDIDIKKLVDLCEQQAQQIRDLKNGSRLMSPGGKQLPDQNKQFAIVEENYKREIQILQDEIHILRAQCQVPVDLWQDQHSTQLRVLSEEIQTLQKQLIGKVRDSEGQKSQLEQLLLQNKTLQSNEEEMNQVIKQLLKIQQMLEVKYQEYQQIYQQSELRCQQQARAFNDQKQQLLNKINQLEEQLRNSEKESQNIQTQLQYLKLKNSDLQNQLEIKEEELKINQIHYQSDKLTTSEKFEATISNLKVEYERQLDLLRQEIQDFDNLARQQEYVNKENQQVIEQLNGFLNESHKQEEQLLKDLEQARQQLDDQKLSYEREKSTKEFQFNKQIMEVKANYEVQLKDQEQHITRVQQILDGRSKENDELRQQRQDLQQKISDMNQQTSSLQNEIETLKNQLLIQQKHFQMEQSVKDEITRSKIEQNRRQWEIQIDQLQNQNRNLQFLLENKKSECEELRVNLSKCRNQGGQPI